MTVSYIITAECKYRVRELRGARKRVKQEETIYNPKITKGFYYLDRWGSFPAVSQTNLAQISTFQEEENFDQKSNEEKYEIIIRYEP